MRTFTNGQALTRTGGSPLQQHTFTSGLASHERVAVNFNSTPLPVDWLHTNGWHSTAHLYQWTGLDKNGWHSTAHLYQWTGLDKNGWHSKSRSAHQQACPWKTETPIKLKDSRELVWTVGLQTIVLLASSDRLQRWDDSNWFADSKLQFPTHSHANKTIQEKRKNAPDVINTFLIHRCIEVDSKGNWSHAGFVPGSR